MAVRKSRVSGRKFSYPSAGKINSKVNKKILSSYANGGDTDYPVGEDPNSSTGILISGLISHPAYSKYNPSDYYDLMDAISRTESQHRNINQEGGPAKGYYQMEKESFPTAIQRAKNYENTLGINLGIDYDNISHENYLDLSKDVQQALALANMSGAARAKQDAQGNNLNEFLDPTKQKYSWLRYHWAGKQADKADRSKHWDDHLPEDKKTKTSLGEPVEIEMIDMSNVPYTPKSILKTLTQAGSYPEKEYEIKEGDTFYGVANRLKDVTKEQLKTANPDIDINAIKTGQKISVPYTSPPNSDKENMPKMAYGGYLPKLKKNRK